MKAQHTKARSSLADGHPRLLGWRRARLALALAAVGQTEGRSTGLGQERRRIALVPPPLAGAATWCRTDQGPPALGASAGIGAALRITQLSRDDDDALHRPASVFKGLRQQQRSAHAILRSARPELLNLL